MTSKIFKDRLAANMGISKVDAGHWLDGLQNTIHELVSEGESFTVADMKVSVVNVPAHTARNPLTGGTVEVPDKNKVKIKAGNALNNTANV